MTKRINGIQQLGVGVTNLEEAFKWYRTHFGMDIKMFDDESVAEYMLNHTEGKPRPRRAILALNMEGGGGFEIWLHTGKKPKVPLFQQQLGDLGINIGKLKTTDVERAFLKFQTDGLDLLTAIETRPDGTPHFYLKDIYGNIWEVESHSFVKFPQNKTTGGVLGTVIGVKRIEDSLKVYQDILGYDQVVYDETAVFNDFKGLPGGEQKYRRMLLKHSKPYTGSFSTLLGPSEVELVEAKSREPRDIYEGRIWGDPGYIHICYDINGMDELREEVKAKGFPFTVDSAKAKDSFDMGEAAGNFAYIKAPEGTLIEFVETHKIPLLKKFGWYLDLRKRGEKPLPNWIFRLFGIMRVK
jgi:catechol 2,3-dioxygenase-like lactoylglutathione lyase family enzyme